MSNLCVGDLRVSFDVGDVRSIAEGMPNVVGRFQPSRGGRVLPAALASSKKKPTAIQRTRPMLEPLPMRRSCPLPLRRSSSQPLSCRQIVPKKSTIQMSQENRTSYGGRDRFPLASPPVPTFSCSLSEPPIPNHPSEAVPTLHSHVNESEVEPLAESDRPHPPSFYCPISHQCMHDPVVLTDGHTYERRHIEQWLQSNDTSPVSGAKLTQKVVFPNHALRNAIEEYFEQVLDGHRQAIKAAIAGSAFSNNRTLMHTIDSLMQCSILINADLTIERVLAKIMQEARSLVGAEVASVFLVDRKRKELYSTVNSTGGELRIPIKSGVAGAVAYSGMPLIIDRAYEDTRFNTQIDTKTGFKTRNILCVPIRAWKSSIIGVAQLINKTNGGIVKSSQYRQNIVEDELAFTNDDQQFLQVLAAQAGAAIVNSGMFESMRGVSGAGRWPSPTRRRPSLESQQSLQDSRCTSPVRGSSSSPKAQESFDESKEHVFCPPQSTDVEKLSAKQFSMVKPLLSAAAANWEMDVLTLAELTSNKPLSTLTMYLFEHCDLISTFDVDREKLERFLLTIERGYPEKNQYHNRSHAASVVHLMHSILSHGGVGEVAAIAATGIEDHHRQHRFVMLAGLLAAAVHDYEHEGVNNDFLVKTSSSKAIMYNDRSPNENHHVAAAWFVLQRAECNFLENLTVKEYRQLRQIVLDMVLSTDMAEHGKTLNKFKDVFEREVPDADTISNGRPSIGSAPNAIVALQLALKCADLGHLSLSWGSHMRWVQRLEAEFFAQGDNEVKFGMPEVSFLMDRTKPGASDTQTGFFDFVVLPLFREFANGFPATQPLLSSVEKNYQQWKIVQSEVAASV